MIKKFLSTYDLLVYLCSKSEIRIRFYQKHSLQLYPEFSFGDIELQKNLFSPISFWLGDGDGECVWSSVDLVFNTDHGELNLDYENEEIDVECFPEYEDNGEEYLLDVNKLKDGEIYNINK